MGKVSLWLDCIVLHCSLESVYYLISIYAGYAGYDGRSKERNSKEIKVTVLEGFEQTVTRECVFPILYSPAYVSQVDLDCSNGIEKRVMATQD